MLTTLAVVLTQVWVCRVDSEFTDFDAAPGSIAFGTYNSFGQLDLASGHKRWAQSLKEGQLGVKVATDGGVTAVSIGSGPISTFDAATGKPKWSISHKGYCSPMLITGSLLYAETEPNRLAALGIADHRALWSIDLEPDSKPTESQLGSKPALIGGHLYMGLREGSLLCLDPTNGQALWRAELTDSPIQSLTSDAERIYATDSRGFIHAVGRESGTEVWRYDARNLVAGSPLLQDGKMVIVSPGGFVVWLNPLNGSELWHSSFSREEDFSVTQPVADGTGIFFMRRSGAYAFDQFGHSRWDATFPSPASFRAPLPFKGDFILFDSHAIFRARPQ